MQLTLLIIGVFVVTMFTEVRIHGMEAPFQNDDFEASQDDGETQTEKGIVEWVQNILGEKPNSTTTSVQPDDCPPCKCGLTNAQYRIVGGVETKKNEYPWMAQLFLSKKYYCGASVISSRYVLTAAHCVKGHDHNRMMIRIGDYDRLSTAETTTQDFKVEKFIVHSGFKDIYLDNDIALIKLMGVIKFGGLIGPVCLAEPELTYSGSKGIVTGWGRIDEFSSTSKILREVTVPIITNAKCRSTNYDASQITDNMLCAGYYKGGKDACQGDSGGPLHVINQNTKIHRLVGIVSWGYGCGSPNYPGVYTRINRYLTWIKNNMDELCLCH